MASSLIFKMNSNLLDFKLVQALCVVNIICITGKEIIDANMVKTCTDYVAQLDNTINQKSIINKTWKPCYYWEISTNQAMYYHKTSVTFNVNKKGMQY